MVGHLPVANTMFVTNLMKRLVPKLNTALGEFLFMDVGDLVVEFCEGDHFRADEAERLRSPGSGRHHWRRALPLWLFDHICP